MAYTLFAHKLGSQRAEADSPKAHKRVFAGTMSAVPAPEWVALHTGCAVDPFEANGANAD